MRKLGYLIMGLLLVGSICIILMSRTEPENSYMLKEYNGNVALYFGEELVEVYDSVDVNVLPEYDVSMLNKGIELESPDEVISYLEDYDG